ncbi:tRNA lysidine(34) synthetase TilS [Roseospira marina]|nr:tRNA lysidine(34) synthetase TilS [Roseospira marina]
MRPLGPFEPAPRLAVGVSGGPDSLALVLLAHDWAVARGGSVTALTVDHGLRAESAVEARAVAAWMAAAGIPHHTLAWHGPHPVHGLQAAARAARFDRLEDWCRRHGVLDLLLAHHRDDQAETLLQRLGQGSGPDGLAGMAPVSYRRHVRVVRPLLDVPGACTRATLTARGQTWIEDPSNANSLFQRVRVRDLTPALADAGVAGPGLALVAARAAERREEHRRRRDVRLVEAVALDAFGVARVDMARLLAGPPSEARAALGRLLACVGGRDRSPRVQPLERLRRHLLDGSAAGMTLGRCHLWPAGEGTWRVCREGRHLPDPMPVPRPGDPAVLWDGRLSVRVPARDGGPDADPGGRWIGALGAEGWRTVVRALREAGRPVPPVPAPARAVLMAVRSSDGLGGDGMVGAVPQIGYSTRSAEGHAGLVVRPAARLSLTEAARRLYESADGLCE